MKEKRPQIIKNQKGFTLIEIIAVLVILGLLAVVAVPRFVNLQTQAAQRSADAVWGAANSVCSLNFANGVLNADASTPITTGAQIIAGMDATPQGWSASGVTILATVNGTTYTITIDSVEVEGTSRAVLSKDW